MRYEGNKEQVIFDWLLSWQEMKKVIEMYAVDGIFIPEHDKEGKIINRHKISEAAT